MLQVGLILAVFTANAMDGTDISSASQTADIVRSYADLGGMPYNVSYNSRSMLVGGKPVLLLSGSVHYTRSTPEMWPIIFAKMKAAGLNAVESYVFWNYHVPTLDARATPDYRGRGNVTLFLQLAAQADLFVIWRIGPYICAEWPGGGMPSWLRQVKDPRGDMHPRTATQPYQDTCKAWMQQHIDLVRPHFATNGGPIIMLQMENELSGPSNTPYVQWLGQLATQLEANLPWIMCHGAHANNTIETCNGCDCTSFVGDLVNAGQPAMWSEDEQWFDRFGQGASVRPTGDLGRGVAAFIAVGGSMHNFYMFHGGTMWGNWSTTVRRTRLTPSYANSANLASDSIVYTPKYRTIALLHQTLQKYASTILHTSAPIVPVPCAPTVVTTGSSGSSEGHAAGDSLPSTTPPPYAPWTTTLNGSAADGDRPLTFLINDSPNVTDLPWSNGTATRTFNLVGRSARLLDGLTGDSLWYSEPDEPDSVGEPYLHAPVELAWERWNGTSSSTWYRARFARPSLPNGAQLSLNLTGFGQGNVFLNGIHVSYFNLQFGECFAPPGGVNSHGSCDTYIRERCDKPTQDCYHVPPSWISDENELLVWNEAKLPANVTEINPNLATIVYRVDPPDVLRAIAPFLVEYPAKMK